MKRYNPPTRPRQLFTLIPPYAIVGDMRKGDLYTLDDYEIREDGSIYSKRKNIVMKPQPNGKGYLRVVIGKKKYFVHRLVAEKYVPNPENKPQVNHINGNKTDNRAENLEWVTNQENRNHAVKSGLHLSGEKCSWAKLTEKDVVYIRSTDKPATILAKELNVSVNHVRAIRRGNSWKTVEKVC